MPASPENLRRLLSPRHIAFIGGSDATLDLITKTLRVRNLGVGVDGAWACLWRGSRVCSWTVAYDTAV